MRNTVNYFTIFLTYPAFFLVFLYIIRAFKKKLDEKEGLVLMIFITAISILYIFSNITWIHDFFVLFFLLSIPILFTSFLFGIEKKVFKGQKAHFYIFLIVIISLFILYSIPMYKQINQWLYTIPPIVKFVAENKGNFLVTYEENPDYHQLRFYTDLRIVNQINTKEELLKVLDNNHDDFKYIIVMPNRAIDKDLLNFLEGNFKEYIISNEYTAFYFR
jgi:hypothetical protein